MLATLSIRAKVIAAVSLLLACMAAGGMFAILQLQAINSSAQDIQTNWLPSIRLLGELRADTVAYRVAARSILLAPDAAAKASAETIMDGVGQSLEKTRQAYEARINSPEERAIYREFVRV
jgi:methyl-accepting chemotaxis protein